MFKILAAFLIGFGPALTFGQTADQCRAVANQLAAINTDSDLASLEKTMTAGDELVLSTKMAACLDNQKKELTPIQFDALDRIGYKLDADVIERMYDFIEHSKSAEAFNDEQERNRQK